MSRWDYDVVFYRVFCVTLLAVAFTFTVILTNVFVDIDGLLTNKKKYMPDTTTLTESITNDEETPIDELKEIVSNEDKNYDSDIDPSYRTKRSIESDATYRAKNPTMKKMLTRRLASLLEELDEEEAKKENFETTTAKPKAIKNKEDGRQGIKHNDLLHLAMHNILLQGLIGHMDLNDVYKKIHKFVEAFNKKLDNKNGQDKNVDVLKSIINSKEILNDNPDLLKHDEENKIFEELIKCKELEEQIAKASVSNENYFMNKYPTRSVKDNTVLIKTVIEINEKDDIFKASNRTNSKENVEGLIKLIYNGKSIKVNQMPDETRVQNATETKITYNEDNNSTIKMDKQTQADLEVTKVNKTSRRYQPSLMLNKVLQEYLKKHALPKYENSAEIENIKSQRSKRQIKIQYSDSNEKSSKINTLHDRTKKEDDDLYIEIETHFDGKGIKGEKKKKVVRNLIDKIQKALHSDIEENRDSVEHIKFVKRSQDPIYSQNIVSLNIDKPLEPIEHRLLDPIDKSLEYHDQITDKLGDTNSLLSKAASSAEINEIVDDYDSVLRYGIPKRLQAPLNTETVDEDDSVGLLNPNSNNVTLFLKNIDGSGFSVGFNQYKGEPPDKDSIKMFNEIENLIREYHKTYDQEQLINNSQANNFMTTYHEMVKRNIDNLPKVARRSITAVGANYYDADNFKILFKSNKSFNNYQDLLRLRKHNFKLLDIKEIADNAFKKRKKKYHLLSNLLLKDVREILHDKSLIDKVKPEMYRTDNHVKRKRRSISVKKISNLKTKIKLNRYLNTKTITNKKVLIMNKRNKRHVNNIRIIAKDKTSQKNSEENIFFISKENSYTGRETRIRAVETPNTKINNRYPDNYDEQSPFSNIYRIQNPVQNEFTEDAYNTAVKSNTLMSKYPHIFIDRSPDSKEEIYFDEKKYRMGVRPYRIKTSPAPILRNKEIRRAATESHFGAVLDDSSVPKEIEGTMMAPATGSNYRITVKMSPKNKTRANGGFKEVHTSVNKSYDDNGLRYYTLLNVSEISKIERLNTTDKVHEISHLVEQQNQIKALLKLHKKRVDLQLNNLLTESKHLEKMIESNEAYNIDKTIKILKDDENGIDIVSNEEKVLNSVKKLQNTVSTKPYHTKTPTTTSEPLDIMPSTTATAYSDKSNIQETIKQNEKVTSEILRKIDTNTQILQTFLQKLSEKIMSDKLDKNEHTPVKTTIKPLEIKLDLSKDWKSYGLDKNAFYIPNEQKNETIPFVYAYQQSIPMQNKPPSESLASLVYHGHIHTNNVENLNNSNYMKHARKIEPTVLVNTGAGNTVNSNRKFNESRYFMDGIENFKVDPMNGHVISANIKINTTNVV